MRVGFALVTPWSYLFSRRETARRTRYTGTVLMDFAVSHVLVAFILFGDWLLLIARGGVGNLK